MVCANECVFVHYIYFISPVSFLQALISHPEFSILIELVKVQCRRSERERDMSDLHYKDVCTLQRDHVYDDCKNKFQK